MGLQQGAPAAETGVTTAKTYLGIKGITKLYVLGGCFDLAPNHVKVMHFALTKSPGTRSPRVFDWGLLRGASYSKVR